jgi:hypothetical protein
MTQTIYAHVNKWIIFLNIPTLLKKIVFRNMIKNILSSKLLMKKLVVGPESFTIFPIVRFWVKLLLSGVLFFISAIKIYNEMVLWHIQIWLWFTYFIKIFVWWILLIDLHKLNHSCMPEMKLPWLWHMMFLICC